MTPDTICAFSYTSGTTGEPKGAMISHKNIITTSMSSECRIKIEPSDIYISYLPMAHTMERNFFYNMVWRGGKVGLYGGDILKLKEDLAILKPTVFASVPRLFNKMYEAMNKAFKEKNYCLRNLIDKGV